MAHVVGVPKRDPCQKCSLPVFLAERLTVGQKVYHRTCLKCARCKSQLSPGSFYETETDGEYCCETCPDEEKSLDVTIDSSSLRKSSDASVKHHISSTIAERLALFEQRKDNDNGSSSKNVLQKSLSDEEKSKSLKKFQENQHSPYKAATSAAFNDFLNNHYSNDASDSIDSIDHRKNSASIVNTSDDDATSEDEMPMPENENKLPQLPKTQPPQIYETKISDNQLFDISKENENKTLVNQSSESENTNIQQIKDIDILLSSKLEENTSCISNVTKDIFEDKQNSSENNINTSNNSLEEEAEIRQEKIGERKEKNTLSMVHKRLYQFENIASENNGSNDRNKILANSNYNNNLKEKNKSINDTNNKTNQVPKNEGEEQVNDEQVNDEHNNKENNASYPENKIIPTIVENILKSDENNSKNNQTTMEDQNEIVEHIEESENINFSDVATKAIQDTPTKKLRKISLTSDLLEKPLENIAKKPNEYPEELNPFNSDEEDEVDDVQSFRKEKRESLNPFDDDDDVEKHNYEKQLEIQTPKKISTNPFGSETEDEDETSYSVSSISSSKRTPVPTPRSHVTKISTNQTPEPKPRSSTIEQNYESSLHNSSGYYGSSSSLSPLNVSGRLNNEQFLREGNFRSSLNSLTSCNSGTGTKKKIKKSPAPPPPTLKIISKELFTSPDADSSKKSSPSSSNAASPKFRKKRPAPAPPSVVQVDSSKMSNESDSVQSTTATDLNNSHLQKLCDEEKAFLENSLSNSFASEPLPSDQSIVDNDSMKSTDKLNENTTKLRLIPLDPSIMTPQMKLRGTNSQEEESHDRQLEKLKDNKEAKNRNRQSHVSLNSASDDNNDPLINKSIQGKWKRRKGPAPALPIPPRKVLQMLPLQEIRHELEVIEVQQQGLEKQGVMLEKMIRDRCEGQNAPEEAHNSKEVEDLILQLFELVNEKNELFRRQAELMYLRRQHRLEQEQADLEYEIRLLMAQPEKNKTDSDKAREESLIARLVEVVQLRNEVVECLEMDRIREAEEDMSIKQRLELHNAKRDEELLSKQTPTKLSKKEKKKQKELKKLGKSKKLDADKDADETELSADKQKTKKKKKKFLF